MPVLEGLHPLAYGVRMADTREPRTPGPRRPAPTRSAPRVLAGSAVVASVVLNVWAISYALRADEPSPPGPLPTTSVATAPSTPATSASRTSSATVSPSATSTPPLPGGKVTEAGAGTFTVVAAPSPTAPAIAAPASGSRVVRYTLEVEDGIDADAAGFAATVAGVLSDGRGWQAVDGVRFVNVTPAQDAKKAKVDLRITLASPETTDELCAPLDTRGEVSCHARGRAVLNQRRWLLGVEAYGDDLEGYRTYLVNHEVGHGLGHGHESCTGDGKDAPVMMQQTYGVKACEPWPWPAARATTS